MRTDVNQALPILSIAAWKLDFLCDVEYCDCKYRVKVNE